MASALGLSLEHILRKEAEPTVPLAAPTKPIPTPAAAPPRLSGSDLGDPANFTELPDASLLEQGGVDEAAFRARLARTLDRANRVLHTSRVPASTWRAWRDFERKIQERLRTA